MKISVTLSANAGVAIAVDDHRLWVDALHERRQKGFSTLTPAMQYQMMSCEPFFDPECICYTHTHPDHYSEKLTNAALKRWPESRIMLPDETWQNEHCVVSEDLVLRFVRLPHEGEQYADVLHYGLLICYHGRNILIPGDCEVASPALLEVVGDTPIHLMLLDFPWITLHRGAEFLKAHFPDVPKIVYHLPFAEDDTMGYRAVTERRATLMEEVQILWNPFQTVTMEL